MKKYFLLFSFLTIIFSCKKDNKEVVSNNTAISKVFASYGYKPVKDLPAGTVIPSSITLDQFKQLMTTEQAVKDSLDKIQAAAKSAAIIGNAKSLKLADFNNPDAYGTDNGYGTKTVAVVPIRVTIHFPNVGSMGLPDLYNGYVTLDGIGNAFCNGTLVYVGYGATFSWSYVESVRTGTGGFGGVFDVTNYGTVSRLFNYNGASYTRAWAVKIHIRTVQLGQIIGDITYNEITKVK